MRREGGWLRMYRAHHKADTMTTTGHIVNAMRDIDDEQGKNDWVSAVVDVPGVGGGVVDRPQVAGRNRSTGAGGALPSGLHDEAATATKPLRACSRC
jgi:hypothetical protein